jgi:carbon monoxide dehydrogenase subunit G
MKFANEIQMSLPADDVFAALTDIERVASCLPGASVRGREGDSYRGAMRVKVGPVVADYGGTLTFAELDAAGRRAVILAKGEQTNGQGSAEARIVTSVLGGSDRSEIVVETELQVRGRVAQFGSGPMEKIAKRLFADFARNLETEMTTPRQDDALSPDPSDAEADQQPGATARTDALDMVDLVAGQTIATLRRCAVPMLLGLIVGLLLGRRRRS